MFFLLLFALPVGKPLSSPPPSPLSLKKKKTHPFLYLFDDVFFSWGLMCIRIGCTAGIEKPNCRWTNENGIIYCLCFVWNVLLFFASHRLLLSLSLSLPFTLSCDMIDRLTQKRKMEFLLKRERALVKKRSGEEVGVGSSCGRRSDISDLRRTESTFCGQEVMVGCKNDEDDAWKMKRLGKVMREDT